MKFGEVVKANRWHLKHFGLGKNLLFGISIKIKVGSVKQLTKLYSQWLASLFIVLRSHIPIDKGELLLRIRLSSFLRSWSKSSYGQIAQWFRKISRKITLMEPTFNKAPGCKLYACKASFHQGCFPEIFRDLSEAI